MGSKTPTVPFRIGNRVLMVAPASYWSVVILCRSSRFWPFLGDFGRFWAFLGSFFARLIFFPSLTGAAGRGVLLGPVWRTLREGLFLGPGEGRGAGFYKAQGGSLAVWRGSPGFRKARFWSPKTPILRCECNYAFCTTSLFRLSRPTMFHHRS